MPIGIFIPIKEMNINKAYSLILLKQFFDLLDSIANVSLAEEFQILLDAISYKTASPRSGKKFLNIARCRLAVMLKILSGENIEVLYKKKEFNRSTVYRALRHLIKSQVIRNTNGRIILNSQKVPGIYFLYFMKKINKESMWMEKIT